jgi:hypothetical protein
MWMIEKVLYICKYIMTEIILDQAYALHYEVLPVQVLPVQSIFNTFVLTRQPKRFLASYLGRVLGADIRNLQMVA